ncbi:MAG: protein translocase subunit SecD [Chloroflexi bacterium]|nr:protein translocase subunit SecD [Chloroflexota bacterium]
MKNLTTRLILIILILALALWIDFTDNLLVANPFTGELIIDRNVAPRMGLDLQGGSQIVMEATQAVDRESMEVARTIIENRTNALGVSENIVQLAGDTRIVGEFPGLEDTDTIINILKKTGLLEFVDLGDTFLEAGTVVQTDFGLTEIPENPEQTVYHTVMTGADLTSAMVERDELGNYYIRFTLSPDGTTVFGEHTTNNINKFLAIVLDKEVISCPSIDGAITTGDGIIQGRFTYESANALTIQLRYGSLPVELQIVETRVVGPTLGEDSLQKSLIAGVIGMIIVMLFMGIYYRLPGIVADLAILFYAALAFAIFKYFHFTLTLPGIAGFLLSTGAALDANILIFERLKEELRNGRTLDQAVEQGWRRAWSSIRDSNIAAIITSGILFWFGSTFGATIVKGFSLTLALGVIISLFTAIFVSRSLLALALKVFKPRNLDRWFGI